jgi:hypothetical protein
MPVARFAAPSASKRGGGPKENQKWNEPAKKRVFLPVSPSGDAMAQTVLTKSATLG